jgi:excisionase family DNA binding protein
MDGPTSLSTEQLAEYLGVSYQRVYLLLSEGKVPPPIRTHGPGFRWGRAQIERWADREWWGAHPEIGSAREAWSGQHSQTTPLGSPADQHPR